MRHDLRASPGERTVRDMVPLKCNKHFAKTLPVLLAMNRQVLDVLTTNVRITRISYSESSNNKKMLQ